MNTTHVTHATLAVDGGEVAWDDRGAGEAILLVHAGVFSGWFAPVAEEAALAGHRVVRMLRAGYAGTPPSRSLSIADHAAHCAAVVDHLGLDRVHAVGHSSASAIVLQLALDRPDVVDRLVLSEPPLVDSLVAPEDLPLLHEVVGPVIGGAMAAADSGEVAAAYEAFMSAICGPAHRDVLTTALGPSAPARAERESAFFFGDEISAVARWTFDEPAARRVVQPALLVQGGASPPPVHRLVARLASRLPDARVHTVGGEDHLLPLRSPARLAVAIADFVCRGARQPTSG